MIRRLAAVALVVALSLLALVAPASAQETPTLEVSAGYAFLRDLTSEIDLPAGWFVDVTGNVTDLLGIVGSVRGNYRFDTDFQTVFGTSQYDVDVHTFAAGPRFSFRANENAVPFVQVLFGAARTGFSRSGTSLSQRSTDLFLQVGAGVNLRLTDSVGLRLGGEYGRGITDLDEPHGFSMLAGVVFGL